MSTATDRFLRVVGSPEIYLKSRPTRVRFMGMLAENVRVRGDLSSRACAPRKETVAQPAHLQCPCGPGRSEDQGRQAPADHRRR